VTMPGVARHVPRDAAHLGIYGRGERGGDGTHYTYERMLACTAARDTRPFSSRCTPARCLLKQVCARLSVSTISRHTLYRTPLHTHAHRHIRYMSAQRESRQRHILEARKARHVRDQRRAVHLIAGRAARISTHHTAGRLAAARGCCRTWAAAEARGASSWRRRT